MNWKIGDRAVILHSKNPERIGLIVTIMSELTDKTDSGGPWMGGAMAHIVDLVHTENPKIRAGFLPENLGPIPDANEKTTWDECVFKPAGYRVEALL